MKYEVFEDANDILIRKGTSELVILISKKTAYIKTRGEYKFVNEKNLGNFFSALETPKFETGIRWLPTIRKGASGMRYLEAICKNLSTYKPLVDRELCILPVSTEVSWIRRHPDSVNNIPIFTDIATVLADFVNKDFVSKVVGHVLTGRDIDSMDGVYPPYAIKRMKKALHILTNFNSFYALYVAFGHSGGRGIIRAIMQDDTMDALSSQLVNLAPNCQNIYKLKWERVAQYITSGRIAQGYAAREENFVNDWVDTLHMSYTVHAKTIDGVEHHKVPKDEKYPKNLSTLHQHYASIINQYSNHNDTALYDARKEELAYYIYTTKDKKYIFILPSSDADMIDEARQQDNCLAGYTTRHANGETTIVFMRYAATPDKSLVTIERRGDTVIQKYRAHNRKVTPEEDAAIREWLKETNKAKFIELRIQQEVERRLKEKEEADKKKAKKSEKTTA